MDLMTPERDFCAQPPSPSGATSSLGQAAVNVAAEHGATVLATTRKPGRASLLRDIGATSVLIDDGELAGQVRSLGTEVDCVFDLVGNSVLRDSLQIVRPGGRVCQLGFLGGLEPVTDFNPITGSCPPASSSASTAAPSCSAPTASRWPASRCRK
jgi:NADPH:quinone reductase-like Zn-dependent oxidoreductase